jgi:hypothetical protein
MPAVPPYIIEPIWQQFAALLPEREVDHPLGCHRPRVPDRVVFEKLVQILVFGCAYWRIADEGCSATTLRRRREEWIEQGAMDPLEELAREAYDGAIGLDPFEVAVDCCITKAPCGGERAGKNPVDRALVLRRGRPCRNGDFSGYGNLEDRPAPSREDDGRYNQGQRDEDPRLHAEPQRRPSARRRRIERTLDYAVVGRVADDRRPALP